MGLKNMALQGLELLRKKKSVTIAQKKQTQSNAFQDAESKW